MSCRTALSRIDDLIRIDYRLSSSDPTSRSAFGLRLFLPSSDANLALLETKKRHIANRDEWRLIKSVCRAQADLVQESVRETAASC